VIRLHVAPPESTSVEIVDDCAYAKRTAVSPAVTVITHVATDVPELTAFEQEVGAEIAGGTPPAKLKPEIESLKFAVASL
jgi:hypothetical protein